jgi:hypothetical protein
MRKIPIRWALNRRRNLRDLCRGRRTRWDLRIRLIELYIPRLRMVTREKKRWLSHHRVVRVDEYRPKKLKGFRE